MLTKKSLVSAGLLAQRINGKGLAIESIPDTPVDNLVGTTTVVADTGKLKVELTSELSTKDGLLPNSHNTELDNFVELGKQAVERLLHTTRNVIIPAQLELLDSCKGLLEESLNSFLADFSVKVEQISPVFRDGNFLALVEEYRNSNSTNLGYNRILKFGAKDEQSIIDLLSTGFKGTDEAIALWVAYKGGSFFSDVWRDFFNNGLESRQTDFLVKITEDRDVCLAVHLISRKLLEDPIGDTGLSLKEYTDNLSSMRNRSGYVLCNALDNLDNLIKGGVLLSRVDDKTIYVIDDVYKDFLDNGGSVDVLFGVLVAGKIKEDIFSNSILANKDKYLKHWHDFVAISNSTALANRYSNLRKQLLAAFLTQLENDTTILGERDRLEYYKAFKEALIKTTDVQLQDLPKAVVELLCKVRYKNENALFILDRICFHCKEQPAITAEEASALATIEYITDWVVSQIKVKALGHGSK